MNIYFILILINLIGLLFLSFNLPAIAKKTSSIALNTFKDVEITNTATCDSIPEDFFSSINKLEDPVEENFAPLDRRQSNIELPQASIWWAVEQFDPFDGNLIQNWLTYPQKRQINLTVNWQLWTILDYFGRYRFVNQFGTVVRKHGYSLNIFSQKEQCLASYKYNAIGKPPKWELHLEKLGKDSLQVEHLDEVIDNLPSAVKTNYEM